MKRVLFINALIIITTSLLFNTVGISFRVFMSNQIGTEGMGLLQLIMSIYMIATLFVVTGINVGVTRLVAEEGGRHSFAVSRALLMRAFSVSFLFSIPAFLFLFFGAEWIGTRLLNDTRTIFSLKLLAAGMPFMGISSCIKGYFYAQSKLVRPAGSQAIEIMIQIAVVMSILEYFMQGGLEYGCAAIVLGIAIAEIVSCMFLLTFYWLEKRKSDAEVSEIFFQKRIIKKMLSIAFPVSVSSLLRGILKAIENIMIPIAFVKYGHSKKLALEEYGQIQGMVMPVLLFPASILIAFSSLLIPEISEANACKHRRRVRYSVTRAIQITLFMSILTAGYFIAFGDRLGILIYDSYECGRMMQILAPLIPLIYIDFVADDLLKGLNHQISTLVYSIYDAILKIALIYFLIPANGLEGFIIVLYISGAFGTFLVVRKLLLTTGIKMKFMDWIFKPALSVAAAAYSAVFFLNPTGLFLSDALFLISSGILMGIFYFLFLIKLGCITREDLIWMKGMLSYSSDTRPPMSK
ncbi:MAG: hypothetical protein K0R19_2343 [Bacillota bacterium]|nr:hypothetical protein [Bacillota bacterium]